MQLLKRHFRSNRLISRYCPAACLPESPELNPCDFWLWGYPKNVVYSGPIANLAELKTRITQHISNVTPETLRFVVEHVYRFQLVADNGGKHIEPVFRKSSDNLTGIFIVAFYAAFWPKDNKNKSLCPLIAVFSIRIIKNRFFPCNVVQICRGGRESHWQCYKCLTSWG